MTPLLLVGFGGGLGAIARYGVNRMLAVYTGFPLATLTVNVLGSLAIGLLAAALLSKPGVFAHQAVELRLLLITGFLGAFTTFSAFSLETLLLVEQREWWRAAWNIFANVALSLLAVSAGFLLSRIYL